jgi:hypothetical protein
MACYHIAQVNIGRVKEPVEHPSMSGFMTRLDEINALADTSPGFVWRLQTSEGNATYFRPYADDRILVNMSVWESIETLRHYVYQTAPRRVAEAEARVVCKVCRILHCAVVGACGPSTGP